MQPLELQCVARRAAADGAKKPLKPRDALIPSLYLQMVTHQDFRRAGKPQEDSAVRPLDRGRYYVDGLQGMMYAHVGISSSASGRLLKGLFPVWR